ncbi:hypothetical protein ACWD25_51655 [Streptomyces sp. NPDC002920]
MHTVFPRQPRDLPDASRARELSQRRAVHRRRAKALLWRAALGAAYAVGTGAITLAVHWLIAAS